MQKINIYSPAGTLICSVDKVVSSSFLERLDGEMVFDFTANQKMLDGVNTDSKIEFAGQYFNISRIVRSLSDGACLVTITAEQETISFADDELKNWQANGTVAKVLAGVLAGTGVSVGVVESSEQILGKAHPTITRRAALISVAEMAGLELEYSGHTVSLVTRGRKNASSLRDHCRVIDIVETVDARSGNEAYEVTVDSVEDLSLGDLVTVDYAPLAISKSKRIVGISYDPFNCDGVSLEIGDYVPNVSEDYANDKVSEKNEADQLAETIAQFDLNMGYMSADIKLLTQWKSGAEDELEGLAEAVAVLGAESDENGASISQIVEAVGSNGKVTAASIVTAVNNSGSSVKIKADAIDIAGAMGGLTLSAVGDEVTETPFGELGSYDVQYGFAKTSDGYYTSTNKGVNNSFAYASIYFTTQNPKNIILRCISNGESDYDYGIISVVNPEENLREDNTEDVQNVFYSFRGKSSPDPVDIPITIPSGFSYLIIKYIKDGSGSTGTDCFKVMPLEVTYSSGGNTSMIRLTYNGTEISSAGINIKGFVTFESLENDGKTTINGNNIALVLDGSSDYGSTNLTSINVLGFKYRDSGGTISPMANIYTEVFGETNDEASRYALRLKTEAFYNNMGEYVYPAIKLLAAGRASIESMFGIYLGTEKADGSYITLDAYDNTRIVAHKAGYSSRLAPYEGYCFCTDGIYYNGKQILSI